MDRVVWRLLLYARMTGCAREAECQLITLTLSFHYLEAGLVGGGGTGLASGACASREERGEG
jgi:hypothetical protein